MQDIEPRGVYQRMRWMMSQGEPATRYNKPAIFFQDWLFCLSEDKEAVLTCFYKSRKEVFGE